MAHDDELVTVIEATPHKSIPLPRQYAHFFAKTARKPAELILTETPAIDRYAISMAVTGKREARAIAADRNAIVWNF